MIVQINNFIIHFNSELTYDFKENLLGFKSYNVNYDDFFDFLKKSTEVNFDLPENEDDCLSVFCQNFEYMELQSNQFLRRCTALNLANILIFNNWIRKSKYIKYKLANNFINDVYYYYIDILINTVTKIDKKLNTININSNSNINMMDFIYDYYN